MKVKLRLAVVVLLLFLVVMVDFTSRSRIMSVLADGVLVCGIVVLRWSTIKRNSLHNT